MKWILLITILLSSHVSIAKNIDPVVAVVNGKKILKSTLLVYHEQNLNFVRSTKKITLDSSLNDLIDRIIGIDGAKKKGINKRTDIIKKMNDIVYHAFIADELSPKLKKINVSDVDIKKYYKRFPEYKTSQILLRLRTIPSAEDVAKAMKLADSIYKKAVRKPKTFAKLAKRYGQTSTAPIGGDMGYQPKVRLTPEYYENIKGRRIGYITKPFRSQYGITIVKVNGLKKYKQIDMNLYQKIIYDEKRDLILSSYFKMKRKKSKITINKKAMELTN